MAYDQSWRQRWVDLCLTPGFDFRLQPELILGAGIHRFSTPQLAAYRAAVIDGRRGGALPRARCGRLQSTYPAGVGTAEAGAARVFCIKTRR